MLHINNSNEYAQRETSALDLAQVVGPENRMIRTESITD